MLLHLPLSLFSAFLLMPFTPHFTLPSCLTPSPLLSLPTLTHSPPPSPALPSHSCRSVSVWSQGGRRLLRQCWSIALTRSSSLAALLWVALSCRQQPSTSLQSSWSSGERGWVISEGMKEGWGGVMLQWEGGKEMEGREVRGEKRTETTQVTSGC